MHPTLQGVPRDLAPQSWEPGSVPGMMRNAESCSCALWRTQGACLHAKAARALHIHEERVGGLHKPLQFVTALLQLLWRVQQVNITHRDVRPAKRQNEFASVTRPLGNKTEPEHGVGRAAAHMAAEALSLTRRRG